MYLIAQLELSYSGVMDFLAIAPRVRAKMEAQGCTMLHALIADTGPLNTITHIWEVADANAFMTAVAALKTDPEFSEIFAVLGRSVVRETLTFASDAPYAPTRG